jgi:hypothetical protein
MSMLAFFPWLQVREAVQVDRFHLACFNKGRGPSDSGSEEQRILDAALAPYRVFSNPIDSATLVRLDDKPYTSDLTENERNDLFVFSQLVAIGGLAARKFFGQTGYCNAADFAFVIQGFRDEPNGTFFDVRKRDGGMGVRVTAESYQVLAPPHLSHDNPKQIDVPLIEALLRTRARGHAIWDRLYGSFGPFIRANTDAAEVAEQSEVVDMVGAFEQALGVWGSEDLRREFEAHFRPTKDISPRDAPRIPPARRNGSSVRRFWIADFYELRNAHAHGDQELPTNLVWDRLEHLLLGAYAFPLLINSLLNEHGPYTLTEEDQTAIDLFEWRGRAKDHLWTRNERGRPLWNKLHIDFLSARAGERLEQALANIDLSRRQ